MRSAFILKKKKSDQKEGSAGVQSSIEGFEYQLLPHLMMHTPRTLCDLGVLAIEWHEHMVPKYAGATAHLTYMMSHSFCNVTLLGWH